MGTIKKRINSFGYAFQGIRTLLKDQPNARIHTLATGVAITLSFICDINPTEWCIIILCIASVFAAEALNSAVEMIADKVSPQFHPLIKKAKDMAAAAVLFLAIAAIIIASLIFLPKL